MEIQSEHLDSEALLAVLEHRIDLQGAHPSALHARSCELCSSRIAEIQTKEEALKTLAKNTPGNSGVGCIPDAAIGELATGMAALEDAAQWLAHIAGCDVCGRKLREATEDFSRELRPEEVSMMAQLKSGTPAWAEQIARRASVPVIKQPLAPQPRKRWIWALPVAAAAMFALVFGTYSILHRSSQPSVANFLAQAYTAERPFHYRLADNGYAPVTQQRSQVASQLGRPQSLLQAEARLSEDLHRNPDGPESLRLRGVAELLETQPDAAIASLTKARELAPEDPNVLFNLGVAYAIRADLENNAKDRGAALDLFGRVLKLEPDNRLALFNRALVYERSFQFRDAVDDWRKYLTLDATSPWAKEAKQHLEAAQQKVNAKAN